MKKIFKLYDRSTHFIAAMMLAALFCTFLIQIFSRYILLNPFGWTLELCLTLWVWIVFFGNAFIVKDRNHVKFDVLYLASPYSLRKIFALCSAAAIAIGMIYSFLPTLDYVEWMGIRKSAVLKIPLSIVFSVYILFMLAVVVRYFCLFCQVLKKGPPDHEHQLVDEDEITGKLK